jgi:hypothetical protein
MGADSDDPAVRLQRWEQAGGTWRVVRRLPNGEITIALDSCTGEEMEQFSYVSEPGDGPFFHGTKAALAPGDVLEAGRASNFGRGDTANFVYLTATMDAAIWGAELALGDGPPRIYRVEPTGPIENDPNLTDQRYPGNPTRSYRARDAIRVMEEVLDWEGHAAEAVQHMRDRLAELDRQGVEAIND